MKEKPMTVLFNFTLNQYLRTILYVIFYRAFCYHIDRHVFPNLEFFFFNENKKDFLAAFRKS